MSEFLTSKKISVVKIKLLFSRNKLLLLNFRKPISLLKNFVLSKFILPFIILKLIFALWKISFFSFALIITEEFTLILSLKSNPDLINSINIGLILNNLDIFWLSNWTLKFKLNGLIDSSPS